MCLTDGTRDLITSNLFWTTENFIDSIELYHSIIHTSDEELRTSLKEHEITVPYYITPTSLYHCDLDLASINSISTHIETPTKVTLEDISSILFPILQKMAYFGLFHLLMKNNFQVIKRGNHLYYIPNNKAYYLSLQKAEGTFVAYRGFRPLLENHLDSGKLAILFIEETVFRIEEPIQNWEFWEGSLVGVRSDFREDMDTRGGAVLDSVDAEKQLASISKGDKSNKIPLDGIYILGNSPNLRKAGVYQTLNMFSRYKDNSHAMYNHLIDFVSRFSDNGHFKIPLDTKETNVIQFYAEINKEN